MRNCNTNSINSITTQLLGTVVLTPIAANITIDNTSPKRGDVLTVSFDYVANDGGTESGTTIQWYADSSPISGAINTSYTILEADEGKRITVGVTANGTLLSGIERFSAGFVVNTPVNPFIVSGDLVLNAGVITSSYVYGSYIGALEDNAPPYIKNLSITNDGLGRVGDTFTCNYTFVSPSGYVESGTTFQWVRLNERGEFVENIVGATSQNHVGVVGDEGYRLGCIVIPSQTATSPANGNPTGDSVRIEDETLVSAAAAPVTLQYTILVNLGNASTTSGANTNTLDDPAQATVYALVDDTGTSRPITAINDPVNSMGKFNNGYETGDDSGAILDIELKSGWNTGNNATFRGVLFQSIPTGYWLRFRAICSNSVSGAITDLKANGKAGDTTVQNINTFQNTAFSAAMNVEENSGSASVLVKENASANFNADLNYIEVEVYNGQPV